MSETFWEPGQSVPVLEDGYVKLVQTWGSDDLIVKMARMSTGGDSRGSEQDARFIDYLWRHGHHSPFECAGLTVELKLPIFVARQLVRHRTLSFNEYSGRYSEMLEDAYVPDVDRVRVQDSVNRQGSGEPVDKLSAFTAVGRIADANATAFEAYRSLLGDVDEVKVSKELARVVLPVSQFTRIAVTGNLRNLLHFVHLRTDAHAQEEIRVFAEQVGDIIQEHYPMTWAAFNNWTRRAVTFSREEMRLLWIAVHVDSNTIRELVADASDRFRPTQRREFLDKLGISQELVERLGPIEAEHAA